MLKVTIQHISFQNSTSIVIETIKKGFRFYLLFLAIISLAISWDFYQQSRKNVIWSDPEGYYMYLPAVFIYQGFEEIPVISGEMNKLEGTDKMYTKFTCGVAILELPFFLGAQAASYILEKDTGGYASLNNLGIRVAAIFYGILGLYVLKKVLEAKFSKTITFVTLLCVYLGTNLLHYTVREAGMSHVYSFFLFACFIWLTPRLLSNPNFRNVSLLGLILGLIVLIRPTNILIAFYFLLYNVYSLAALKERMIFLFQHLKILWILPVVMFLVFIPQFAYWYYMSGKFVMYSYKNEGFIYWKNPKIKEVLFGVQNGWLIYSPMAGMALLGLFLSIVKRKYNGLAIGIVMFFATYLFGSWWCWWFGGAFGYRSFVEFYALLAIPFAFLLQQILRYRQFLLTAFVSLLLIGLIYYNVKLMYLYTYPWNGPDWNWNSFGWVLKQLWPPF